MTQREHDMERALRVIYTWASFSGGVALDPAHVRALIERTIDIGEKEP